jgi:hypothetical protein
MGITLLSAEFIIQEHCYRALPPVIHLLGRQTVCFDYETARSLMYRHGITPANAPMQTDESTRTAITGSRSYISDTTFFGMLGVNLVHAIDHSDYEGADILVDLNRPIAPEYEGIADFIFGGSVLDNVFDPACYMRNITRMLRPGGRLIDVNACSFGEHPYLLISPAWYFDYCVLNRFVDCSLYVSEGGPALSKDACHIYALDLHREADSMPDLGDPGAGMRTHVIIVAEKGESTTWENTPSQDQYRGDQEWQRYRVSLAQINASQRPNIRLLRPTPTQLAGYGIRRVRGLNYLGVLDASSPETPDSAPERALIDAATANGIRVIEATYGWNQRASALPRTANVPLRRGNVTDIIAFLINGQDGCDIEIDVQAIGDPAPGLPKDLSVLYYNSSEPEPRVQSVYLAPEAHGKRLKISSWRASGGR